MKEYVINVFGGRLDVVKAKQVKVKSDNTIIFYNPKKSIADQYMYGYDVVAVFKPGEYSYFTEM